MNVKNLAAAGALILATTMSTNYLLSQEQETPKKATKPAAAKKKALTPEEEMAIWMKYSEPSEGHKLLKSFEGKWDAAVKMWMAPNAPPNESKGTMENKLILGGRFLQEDYQGDFMGKPFSGMGLFGYDNYKKKYNAIWTDTMSTMIVPTSGTADPSGKVITATGQFDDVASGKKKKIKSVTRIIDDKKHVFEWFEEGNDGKMKKTMEITYTRK